MALKIKPGVTFDGLSMAGARILEAGARASRRLGRDILVSSVTDGDRLPTDPHPLGEAVDFSIKGMTDDEILLVYQSMSADLLITQFTILYEVPVRPDGKLRDLAYVNPKATGPHIHAQRKKGTTYL
jgi:hypothetical protein